MDHVTLKDVGVLIFLFAIYLAIGAVFGAVYIFLSDGNWYWGFPGVTLVAPVVAVMIYAMIVMPHENRGGNKKACRKSVAVEVLVCVLCVTWVFLPVILNQLANLLVMDHHEGVASYFYGLRFWSMPITFVAMICTFVILNMLNARPTKIAENE